MTNENAINVLRYLSPPRTSKAAFDAFRQAIDMAIEALSQPEPHWIPVTERLPIEYDNPIEFLCTLEYKKDVRYVDLIVWNGSDWENNYTDDNKYSDYGIDKVVAWMSLPTPFDK